MKKILHYPLLILVLSVVISINLFIGCFREPDGQLIVQVDIALQEGNFCNHPEALDAVYKLLSRDHYKAKKPEVIDCLITTAALYLTDNADWTNPQQARKVYDLLKRYPNKIIMDGLVRTVFSDPINRPHILFFGIKLGIQGSEER